LQHLGALPPLDDDAGRPLGTTNQSFSLSAHRVAFAHVVRSDCHNSQQCGTPTCVSVEWRGAQEDARAAKSINAAPKFELRNGLADIRLRNVGGTRKMRVHPASGRGV